jgi:hypothetical protein
MYSVETEGAEEIIGYHFHPNGQIHPNRQSRIRYPHLHLGKGARIRCPELESTKAHLPTRRVCFEQFVMLLIEVFGVYGKPDHGSKLQAALANARKYATWHRRPIVSSTQPQEVRKLLMNCSLPNGRTGAAHRICMHPDNPTCSRHSQYSDGREQTLW